MLWHVWLECSRMEREPMQTDITEFYKKMNIARDGRRQRFKLGKIALALGPEYTLF